MTLKHIWKTALTGLKTNKSRSLLTILGIVIGIASIIVIMSLGAGAQSYILGQIQGLGSKTIVVIPGRTPKGPSDATQTLSDSLKQQDVISLSEKSNVPTLKNIVPLVLGPGVGTVGSSIYHLTVYGANEKMADLFSLDTSEGNFITADDVTSHAGSAVIGSKVKDELFGEGDALGQFMKIGSQTFRIVGVLPQKGQVSFFNFDEAVIVPYTTAQDYIFGIKYYNRIFIEPDTQEDIDQTVADITLTLRENHKITDPDKDDFNIQTQADLAKTISGITTTLTLFLVAVASIALLVGGIGIMNIMLVSVTERTKEIGLRKALGATNKDILTQFLLESVALTALGGLIGIAIGTGISLGIGVLVRTFAGFDWQFSFPWLGAVLGLGTSGLVGLVFGIYPAKKAAEKSPMEALRYE